MKKWLSILGVIGLTTISTASLISCEKPNNTCEKKDHRNWKEQCYNDSSFAEIDNKYYIIIWRNNTNNNWRINKFNNNNILISIVNDNYPNLTKFRGRLQISNSATDRILWESDDGSYFKSVYRWDGNNDPQIPEIDDNGKITNWNK